MAVARVEARSLAASMRLKRSLMRVALGRPAFQRS